MIAGQRYDRVVNGLCTTSPRALGLSSCGLCIGPLNEINKSKMKATQEPGPCDERGSPYVPVLLHKSKPNDTVACHLSLLHLDETQSNGAWRTGHLGGAENRCCFFFSALVRSWAPRLPTTLRYVLSPGLLMPLSVRCCCGRRQVSAHTGAVVCVRWSPDGSALCSCGEDGDVKARRQSEDKDKQRYVVRSFSVKTAMRD